MPPRTNRTTRAVAASIHDLHDGQSSQGLASLIPSTQEINRISSRSAAAAVAMENKKTSRAASSNALYLDFSSSSSDESDTSAEEETASVAAATQFLDQLHQANIEIENDEQSHNVKAKKGERSFSISTKRSHTGKPKAKNTKWTHEEDMDLLSKLAEFVKNNQGMLPGGLRTTKDTTVSQNNPWRIIGKNCTKASFVGMDEQLVARACSNRWNTIRGNVQVRRHHSN